MKKLLYCTMLLMMNLGLFGQCPISVGITALPDAINTPVCKGDPVLLTAIPSALALTPTYIWIIDGDTSFTAGTDTTVLAYNQTVQVIMQTTTGCAQDTVISSAELIQVVVIQESVTQLNYDCVLDVADIQITQSGGTAPINYDLSGIGTNTTGLFNAVPTGSYNLFMVDNQGCRDTGQVVVVNDVVITSNPVSQITECNQTTADVKITTTGGTPSYSYDLVGVGTSSDGSYADVPQGSYILYTTDSDGCKDTSQVTITPFECPPPSPTEVITPNDDGFNDMWQIYNIQYYPENEVFIFDRWGQRVYHKNGYDNNDGWQAKYIGVDMPVSTYYYILKITLEQSDDIVLKGAISVFR